MHHDLVLTFEHWVYRQAQEVRISKQVPFFARPDFYPSPPRSFNLPVYAEAISSVLVSQKTRPTSRARLVDPRVLQFFDDCAVESDSQSSDSEASSSSPDCT